MLPTSKMLRSPPSAFFIPIQTNEIPCDDKEGKNGKRLESTKNNMHAENDWILCSPGELFDDSKTSLDENDFIICGASELYRSLDENIKLHQFSYKPLKNRRQQSNLFKDDSNPVYLWKDETQTPMGPQTKLYHESPLIANLRNIAKSGSEKEPLGELQIKMPSPDISKSAVTVTPRTPNPRELC